MKKFINVFMMILAGGGLLWLLDRKDFIIGTGYYMGDLDLMSHIFWLVLIATSISFLMGGLLVFLCFRPYIQFADWCKNEMHGRDECQD